jgi:type III secretion protein C
MIEPGSLPGWAKPARAALFLALALMAGLPAAPAVGAPIPDEASFQRRFVYKANAKRLSDVLTDFAASQGQPVVVDPKVEGVVSGNFDTTPREFLAAITRAYSVIWYHDGTSFYFYPASAIQSRIFRLKGYRREQVVRLLDSLQLSSNRYPIRYDGLSSTLLVYGPPRHVELIGLAIESLDIGAIEGNRRVARVIALQSASAGDRQLGGVTVAGVVTTLRAVFSSDPTSPPPIATAADRANSRAFEASKRLVRSMGSSPAMAGRFLPDSPTNSAGADEKTGSTPAPRAVRSPLMDDTDDDVPVFEADESTNSVIVYCKGRRIEQIVTLIRSLDQAPMLVELEAAIIEISRDSLTDLGIDWSFQWGQNSVSINGPAATTGAAAAAVAGSAPFRAATLLRGSQRALLASLHALEGDGRARVVSKPRVLGLANRPAVMSDKQIANIRVAGNLEANLFQVEVGTVLEITPQIGPVNAGNGEPTQIKLSIFIQDGAFQNTVVDQVPIIKRTEIRTEARVLEGESLLIGGITIDSDSSGVAGLPGLKDAPVVGGLFRQTTKRSSRSERMFLLTPRIVSRDVTPAVVSQTRAAGERDATTQPSRSTAPAAPLPTPAAQVPAPLREDEMLQALFTRLQAGSGKRSAPLRESAAGKVRNP